MKDDLGNEIDPAYLTKNGGKGGTLWTEKRLEEYGEKSAKAVAGNARGSYSICDIHRLIYHKILDQPETLVEKDVQDEVMFLLEQAFAIAKKTDARLRMYKNNYDQDWWEEERAKHADWMKELKSK
jgi:GH35 family endo-1,4-beta-xylanase